MVDVIRTFYKQVYANDDFIEKEAEFIFSNFKVKDYRGVVKFMKKYKFKNFLKEFKHKTIFKINFLIKIEHKEAKCFDKNINLFFKEKIIIEDKETTIYEIKTYNKYCNSYNEERSFSDEEGYFDEEDNFNEYKDFVVIANVKIKSYIN